MTSEILQIGHPTLRKIAKSLTKEEILSEEIQTLIKIMCKIMHEAPGVGLAAPQIGQSLQIITIEDKPEYTKSIDPELLALRERQPVPLHVLINPKIITKQRGKAEFFEGCLSISEFIGIVPRSIAVTVEALNERAEPVKIKARGWYARILQHEIDHLNGTLCIDHMRLSSLMTIDNYVQYWSGKPIADVLGDLA